MQIFGSNNTTAAGKNKTTNLLPWRFSGSRLVSKPCVAAVLIILFLVVAFAAILDYSVWSQKKPAVPEVFVGVDVGFGDEELIYNVTDAVSGYANLIIVGSLDITRDTAKLTRVCNYLYEKDFFFIVYVGFSESGLFPPRGPEQEFLQTAIDCWGNQFLGAYMFDEIGGKQMDGAPERPVPAADSYGDAADHFLLGVVPYLSVYQGAVYYDVPTLKLYTSDYALYWYDYLCGYDIVFGEFVGNQSRDIAVSLCRGAAKALDKEWGVIVTFSECKDPKECLGTPEELYNDMHLAWKSGAKYVVVFDSPGPNGTATTPYGILTDEYLEVMKKFWDEVQNSDKVEEFPANAAYVLPTDYGYGFRGPDDRIWGLWNADNLSATVWNDANRLITQYGGKLDIVYDNKIDDVPVNLPYETLYYWNGTIIKPQEENVLDFVYSTGE